MRYTFWILFCAFVCFLLAQKSGSLIGVLGTAQVITYGGLVGLGIAVATSSQFVRGLGLWLLVVILWIVIVTAIYFWVFRPVSYGTNREVLFWGGVFSTIAPAIYVFRGMATWLISFMRKRRGA